MSTKPRRLMLLDGHALAYRAYYALQPMTTLRGEPANAIYGFASMLLKAIADYPPDYVVLTFDAGKTFRHELYPDYKATRQAMPDDLRVQIEQIKTLAEAFSIPVFTKEGYEADDLLGTLSKQAEGQGIDTIIITGDTDTFQLVSPLVRVLAPQGRMGEAVLYDETRINERYTLKPTQLIDYKALKGDSSDNIPGVRGIGEKGATSLVAQYGSVEGIYERLYEVKPERTRKALEAGREAARESKQLVTIVRDVPGIELGNLTLWGEFDRAAVMQLLRELGFTSLVGRIPRAPADETPLQGTLFAEPVHAAPQPETAADYRVTNSETALLELVEELKGASLMALDTETTSTNPMQTELVGISLAAEPGRAFYLPIGHVGLLETEPQLPLELVRQHLGPLLADAKLPKVLHNADFDLIVLEQHGLHVEGLVFDTMIAAWLLEPEGRGLGLKNQAFIQLGVEMTPIDALIGKGKNQKTMDQVAVSQAAPYATADADMTLQLVDKLRPQLVERKLTKLFEELEMPLVPVLMRMEMHGMVVDPLVLQEMSAELGDRISKTLSEIYQLAGHPFNVASPKQLGDVLFKELKLQTGRRTQTGYSTDAAVMEELRHAHPIVPLILEQRQMEKLRGTYLDALPQLINPATGRIHTSFNQTGSATGRLSSSNPNLQNIPVRTEMGQRVRSAFVAPEGATLLSCDYSQIELRLLAHFSEDPEMIGAFERDEDVHTTTAAAIYGIPPENVTKDQRSLAKAINFGLMYGMSDFGLSARTDLSVGEASKFTAAYFARFKRVKQYLDEIKAFAREHGYVETVLGRRRYFPELQNRSTAAVLRQRAERAAVNMPIQGSAADMIKLAMIEIDRSLAAKFKTRMILQVHDELVFEVPHGELEHVRQAIVGIMEHAMPLRVPVQVGTATGSNWMEMN